MGIQQGEFAVINNTDERSIDDITRKHLHIPSYDKDTKVDSLDELIKKLHDAFSGDSVDVDYVSDLMSNYKSNPQEWRKFAKFDRYRYTRNLVDSGNGKFNLMIICWGEGHGSAIHDHADAHCFMKILQGSLCEVRFEWPKDTALTETEEELLHNTGYNQEESEKLGMKEIGRSMANTNDVVYINDSLGLHRVENPSHINSAISLHLYCPPFDQCSVFNQRTGQRTKCNVTFWSRYGERRNKEIQNNRAPEDN